MDGLIFDTEALYARALVDEVAAMGLDAFPDSVMRSTIGLSWPATQSLFREVLPKGSDTKRLFANWTTRYEDLAATDLQKKPGVLELLDLLDELAIPRAVATSSKRATAISHLASHDLLKRFEFIIAEEDCLHSKPDPEPYQNAAKALGISPEYCVALEDSQNGVRSAYSAGMTTIMVPDLIKPDRETAARCSYILDSLLDVVTLLER